MKINKPSNRRNRYTDKNFTRDISIAYIAVFATLMILSSRMVSADINAPAGQAVSQDRFPTLIAVGRGELTWFGLSIYQASLWTPNGEFQNLKNSLPIALTITYEKNIDSEALVERTVEEWEHLGIFDKEKRSLWAKQLRQIWPNVKPGDSITTLVNHDRKTRFYYNSSLLKELDDPAFGTALLSIWLHPKTSEPNLRAKLIGQQES